MHKIILKVRYFGRLSKTFKRVTSFFLSNPVPFNKQNYQKQKGPGTRDQSVTIQVMKQVQKNSFINYALSDQV